MNINCLNRTILELPKDLAMEYARWLSPHFAIWTNDQIKELLTKGNVSLNNNKQYTVLQISENVSMQVIPSDKHIFLVTTKELARAIGITESSLRGAKHRYKEQFQEDIHFISNFMVKDEVNKLDVKTTVWSQKGVIEHVKYTRRGNSVVFRTWAEQITQNKPVKKIAKKPVSNKYKHNRITQDRLVDILIEVNKVEKKELRASLIGLITGK